MSLIILLVSIFFGFLVYSFAKKEANGREHILLDSKYLIFLVICPYIIYINGIGIESIIFVIFGYLISSEKYNRYIDQFCQGLLSVTYAFLLIPVKLLEGSLIKKRPYEYLLLLSYFLTFYIPNSFLTMAAYILLGIGLEKIYGSVKSWKNLSTYLSKQTQNIKA